MRPFLTLDRFTQSPRKCIECEVASGCAWCQGENYDAAHTDTIYERSTAICLMHKARVRANNYYWNKLYRKLELPIAALVYSGGKSLHAIVRVDAEDYEEYRKRVDFLYDFMGKNGVTIGSPPSLLALRLAIR